MHSPLECHMEVDQRILRYLKATPGKGLMFSKNNHLNVEAFTYVDWAGSLGDKGSTSEYCTFQGGNLIMWRSKKQTIVVWL